MRREPTTTMACHGVVYSQLCNSIVQYLLSDMTFTSNLSFLLDGLDWLQERIMSTDLPLPPAATASSDISRIIGKVIVHEVIVRSRCKMYSNSDEVQVVIVCRNMKYAYYIINY